MESRIHREVYVRFGREYGTVEIDDRLCLPHDLDVQVGKLKLAKANYLSEKYDLEDKIIQYYPKKLAMIREQIESYEKDLNVTNDVEEFSGMSLQGKFYEEKELAGNALLLICKQDKTSNQKEIGQYRGFELKLSYDSFYNYHK